MSKFGELLRGIKEPATHEVDEADNIHRLERDAQPTRPHRDEGASPTRRAEPWPFSAPPARQAQDALDKIREYHPEIIREPAPAPAPASTLPPATVSEIDAATNILELLLEHEGKGRDRVKALVDRMMELFAPPPAEPAAPDVTGNPV